MLTTDIFDRYWRRYDEWYEKHSITAENELRLVEFSLSMLPRRFPCLEIGVGTGWFASKIGCSWGVDPSFGMVELAHMRGIEVLLATGERLPFRNDVFNVVLLVVTLCFVDNP